MAKLIEFASTSQLDEQLAKQVVMRLQDAIEKRGKASLVVSGGRTPKGLFQILSQQKLDWSKVYITLADERWVDATDDASNERTVRESLLQHEAAKATFIGLKNQHDTPFAGEAELENALQAIPLPFDVVILGMGDDGHTASFFPGAAKLKDALDLNSTRRCLGITPLTAPHDRMTLTLATLLNSAHIYVHITGAGKHNVYEQAMMGDDIYQMPIRSVIKQTNVPVDIFWAK